MSGLIDFFLPKEKKFFLLLEKQVEHLANALSYLESLVKKQSITQKQINIALKNLDECTKGSEEVNKEITAALHKTFITPIDRDKIQELTTNLTRMTESIGKITFSISYCQIKKADKHHRNQIDLLTEAVKLLQEMFVKPLDIKQNREHISKLILIEQDADAVFRRALGDLFKNGHQPMLVLRKKEVYSITEEAIDDVRHIAGIFETILINHS